MPSRVELLFQHLAAGGDALLALLLAKPLPDLMFARAVVLT